MKEEYIEKMGSKLGSFYYALWQETAWLHRKWHEYVELYGTKESRVNLLNKSAPSFFGIVQGCLFDDVLLHIARLTDFPKSCGKENLSLLTLPTIIDNHELKANVENSIKVCKEKTSFCRTIRHKKLAHKDLDHAIRKRAVSIPGASRKNIKDALASIAVVLNVINRHYRNSETRFDLSRGFVQGAGDLLHIINYGLKYSSERQRKIEVGDIKLSELLVDDL